jgi:hypothetical protein
MPSLSLIIFYWEGKEYPPRNKKIRKVFMEKLGENYGKIMENTGILLRKKQV